MCFSLAHAVAEDSEPAGTEHGAFGLGSTPVWLACQYGLSA